jgi:hypothetical protein
MDSFDFFPPPIFSPRFQPAPLQHFHDLSVPEDNDQFSSLSVPFSNLDDFNLYSSDNDGYSSPSLSLMELESMRSMSSASSSNSASPEHFGNNDDDSTPEPEYVQLPPQQIAPVSLLVEAIQPKPVVSSSTPTTKTIKTESGTRKGTKRKKASSSPVAQPIASSPSLSSGDGVVEDAAAKRRRLLRKAELARLSRKRKKTKLTDLEDQVKRLQDELAKAREQIQQATASSEQPVACVIPEVVKPVLTNDGKDLLAVSLAPLPVMDDAEKSNIETTIQAIIERKSETDDNSEPSVHNLLEHFALLHLRRVTYADVHLSSLQHLLSPSIPLEFLSWIMTQPDAPPAASYSNGNSTLYSSLFYEQLGVTSDEQKIELNALRTTIRKQHKWDAEMRKAWHKLDVAVRKSMKQQNDNLERLRSILSEEQMQKYLAWVKQYGEVCLKIQV